MKLRSHIICGCSFFIALVSIDLCAIVSYKLLVDKAGNQILIAGDIHRGLDLANEAHIEQFIAIFKKIHLPEAIPCILELPNIPLEEQARLRGIGPTFSRLVKYAQEIQIANSPLNFISVEARLSEREAATDGFATIEGLLNRLIKNELSEKNMEYFFRKLLSSESVGCSVNDYLALLDKDQAYLEALVEKYKSMTILESQVLKEFFENSLNRFVVSRAQIREFLSKASATPLNKAIVKLYEECKTLKDLEDKHRQLNDSFNVNNDRLVADSGLLDRWADFFVQGSKSSIFFVGLLHEKVLSSVFEKLGFKVICEDTIMEKIDLMCKVVDLQGARRLGSGFNAALKRFIVASGNAFCGNCFKAGNSKVCSRCSQAHYCSQECQRNDWPEHKLVCMSKNK